MSSSIIYPYTNENNYTFDNDKITVSGGVAKLKLIDDEGLTHTEDFADDTGFTYDNIKAEFSGGVVQQKDLIPANATFGAAYTTSIDGNWGNGTLIGTAIGGASVSGGRLDLTGGGKSVNYDANLNADSQQVGCVRLKYTPNFTGAPPEDSPFFTITKANGNASNIIMLRHNTNGQIQIFIEDSGGSVVINELLGIWSNVKDTEYEFELNWDITTGATRLFIDGVQFGITQTGTGTRDANITFLNVGGNFNNLQFNDSYIDDFIVFSVVQHTANYTLGYTVYEYKYLASKVELPAFAYTGGGTTQAFTSFTVTDNNTPKYIINDLYYNSGWVSSDGTYAQANTEAEVLANILTLPEADTVNIDIVFNNSNTNQMDADDLVLTYTGQIYPTDNPTILTNSSFVASELLTFSETATTPGSDEVKYTISVSGTPKWSNAGTVETSNDIYAESNTDTEITTDIADFVISRSTIKLKSFLHSDDGSTTPELDLNSFSYDASLPDPNTPTLVDLNGFIYDMNGPISGESIKVRPYNAGYMNVSTPPGIFQKYEYETIATTDSDGFFSGNVYVQPSDEFLDIKIGKQSYKTKLPDQDAVDFSSLILTLIED